MGYTTDFHGSFKFDKPLDADTLKLMTGLAGTRRMGRKGLGKEFGVEGEFYIDGKGHCGQDHEDNIINFNSPPKTQPGLWCQWVPNEAGTELAWDGNEKFYAYVEWLNYLINSILAPRGYKLNGEVSWMGEDYEDQGKIIVKNNKVKVMRGHVKVVYKVEA
jgi:hypothetical protein